MASRKDAVFADLMAAGGRSSVIDQNHITNLMVNYLPSDMRERELYELFCNFGGVKQIKIIRDFETGISHCYGFVNFEVASDAAKAMACLNGLQVRGKRLKVSMARPSSADIKNAKIYVGNLPTYFNEQQLQIMFGRYGNIIDLNILRNRLTGQPRGIAFVRYELRSSAEMAISVMHGCTLQVGHLPLQVRLAARPCDWMDNKQVGQENEPPPIKTAKKRLLLDSVNVHAEEPNFKRPSVLSFKPDPSDSRPIIRDHCINLDAVFGSQRSSLATPKPVDSLPSIAPSKEAQSLNLFNKQPIAVTVTSKSQLTPVPESSLGQSGFNICDVLKEMGEIKNTTAQNKRPLDIELKKPQESAAKQRGFSMSLI